MNIKQLPLTDLEERALRERNETRARQAIERLGSKYVCHPVNAPQRMPARDARSILSRYLSPY